MALHHFDAESGQVTWFCDSPDCPHHVCGQWEDHRTCVHHGPGEQPTDGEPIQVHVSHPGIELMPDGDLLGLPPCPACGRRMFIKTRFSEQELRPPQIDQVQQPGSPWHGHVRGVIWPAGVSTNLHLVEWRQEQRQDDQGRPIQVRLVQIRRHPAVDRHRSFRQAWKQHRRQAEAEQAPLQGKGERAHHGSSTDVASGSAVG